VAVVCVCVPVRRHCIVCTYDKVLRRELEGHTLRSGCMWVRISDEKREQKDITAKLKVVSGAPVPDQPSRLHSGKWVARLAESIHVCFSSYLKR
jgi:hypothetical protein